MTSTVNRTGHLSPTSALNQNLVTATGSTTARSLAARFADVVNVKDFGAAGDGVTDDTGAIQAALAAIDGGGTLVFPDPASTYIYNAQLVLKNGMRLIGSGAADYAKAPRILINAGASTAVLFADAASSATAEIENLRFENNGGTGHAMRATRRTLMRNVHFKLFALPVLFEHDADSIGPYGSVLDAVVATYCKSHGIVIGNGANVVTLLNVRSFWNGWTNQTPPADPTAYNAGDEANSADADGVFMGTAYNPNAVPVYVPEGVAVLGGDASYNSRYGWNFAASAHSDLAPGYAEWNSSYGLGLTMPGDYALRQAAAQITDATSVVRYGVLGTNNGAGAQATFRRVYGSAIPTTGKWTPGDEVLNYNTGTYGNALGWRNVVGGEPGTWAPIGTIGYKSQAITYSASMTPDVARSIIHEFVITVTDTNAMTLNAPTNQISNGQDITFRIVNSSGGAMGTITWDTVYKLAGGSFTNPANGTNRSIAFRKGPTNWYEVSRSSGDVTN